MRVSAGILIGCMLIGPRAIACSPMTSGYFEPTLETWMPHPGPAQLNRSSDGDFWEEIPAPVVHIERFRRGETNIGVSDCRDFGWLEVDVSLQAGSTYDIKEFAVYFRIVEGKTTYPIFPNSPLTGFYEESDTQARLVFAWLDDPPGEQAPIDLVVEVFLVTNGLNIGPASKFSLVEAALGQQGEVESPGDAAEL